MKKVIVLAFMATFILVGRSVAQQETVMQPVEKVLQGYYLVKDALVAGDAKLAAANAASFLQLVKFTSGMDLGKEERDTLMKTAATISGSADLREQRKYFSDLTNTLTAVTVAHKPGKPVYEVYCPMKKASWLTEVKEIKNPYYGSSMLTCGEIKRTL